MPTQSAAVAAGKQPYFPHIDGLRAIAVISVLLFHLEFVLFSGGFIGVDVFFVISGYLITAHLRSAVTEGRFSFGWFYAKRARRLLPALFATFIATFIASWFILPAPNLERLGQETLFALFSVSNVLFWNESGYFDTASTLKPLLHTWSLSVEEQFYLFWPLLLCFVRREKAVFILLLSLGLVSLIAAELFVRQQRELVFYMMPFRIVEFCLGGILVWLERREPLPGWLQECLVALGLLAIVIPVFAYTEKTVFPGLTAVIPCVGTAVVIAWGAKARVSVLLRWRPVVAIGLVSYSLYLNHWPLIVLYKYVNHEFSAVDKCLLLVVSLVLAALMYQFIETPFRSKRVAFSRKPGAFTSIMGGAAATVIGVSVLSLVFDGFASRFERQQLLESDIEAGKKARFELISADCRERGWDVCNSPSLSREKNVLVIGDSHTVDAYNILRFAYPEKYYVNVSLGGCPPTVNNTLYEIWEGWSELEKCDQLNKKRLDPDFLKAFDTIVIAVYWGRYKPEHLLETYNYISNAVDAEIVVFGNYLTLKKSMADLHNQGVDPRVTPEVVNNFALFEEELAQMAVDRYRFVSKKSLLCGDELSSCELYYDGKPFSYDEHHMSLEAAEAASLRLEGLYSTWDSFIMR
ncbi:acyltransferase family protein [Gilvimarinus algae]|uniref:Acyltransferase family protein n=1 Tax=Gilvimarinus algae TaxID=3058037 RepID=A0ABT8TAP6_9GAMM|nr:acyltransferase family protein [Gilvimarinus sp. SDUM040014]MDO3381187.1 acyltransferase family protein [Gilvimarinus sp. SDUM040014]